MKSARGCCALGWDYYAERFDAAADAREFDGVPGRHGPRRFRRADIADEGIRPTRFQHVGHLRPSDAWMADEQERDVARRHSGQRDAAPRRPASRHPVSHVPAGAAQPRDRNAEVAGPARDRQEGAADGFASLHDPMSQSAPPAPPESLPAPDTSTAASSAHPGPARALSPSGHRRHAPLEARGDVGVARCQQRRDHAPLLGGGLDRSPARSHRRACGPAGPRQRPLFCSWSGRLLLAAVACLIGCRLSLGGRLGHGDRRRDAVRSLRRTADELAGAHQMSRPRCSAGAVR